MLYTIDKKELPFRAIIKFKNRQELFKFLRRKLKWI